MAYFSQSKGDSDKKSPVPSATQDTASLRSGPESVSTLGRGMLVTGNITSVGAVQILGRVKGDIHATSLTIGEGAHVDGNVTAQELTVVGSFKGTVHANSVKLQATAVVDGEVFNKSLTIEQGAQFEGVSRRLERAVEAPSGTQASGTNSQTGQPMTLAEVVPITGAAS
jgi:cytoskeletal protein CcmA (bactofilin family)